MSEEERRYETGEKAQLLDIVTVPLNSHTSLGHQTENHILADNYYWAKEGTATLDQVAALIDPYDANFWVQAESTYHGLNDKVSVQVAAVISSSLKLIATTNLQIHVLMEEGFEGRPSIVFSTSSTTASRVGDAPEGQASRTSGTQSAHNTWPNRMLSASRGVE